MLHIYLSLIEDLDDRREFEYLYTAYRKQMFLAARSVLSEDADAEDAVHEVFLKVATRFKKIAQKIKTDEDMRYYLLRATKNAALNIVRKTRREENFDEKVEPRANRPSLSDGEFLQTLCQKADHDMLVQSILSLDERYREVLHLHFVMELSIEETAKLLDRKTVTVKKQLVRGKALLLQNLKKEASDHGDHGE